MSRAFSLGIIGALLMYTGDLLLFCSFTANDISLATMVNTMTTTPKTTLYLGGFLGPGAAILYCFGFYGISLGITKPKSAIILLGLFCFSYIYGGSYHSHFPYFPDLALAPGDYPYLTLMTMASGIPMALASIFFIYLVLRGKTLYPKRLLFFSPFPLILLTPLWSNLPACLLTVIGGGWNNLIFIIFFTAARLLMKKS